MQEGSLSERLQEVTKHLVERYGVEELTSTLALAKSQSQRAVGPTRMTHASTVQKTQRLLDKVIQSITRRQIQAIAMGSDFTPFLEELRHRIEAGDTPTIPEPLWERISYAAPTLRPHLEQLAARINFTDAFGQAKSQIKSQVKSSRRPTLS